MPKTRQRVITVGAKSIAMRIKNKIGGRKSFTGTNIMSTKELTKTLENCNKRDRNKLRRALAGRDIVLPS